jgi:hypothetical protein
MHPPDTSLTSSSRDLRRPTNFTNPSADDVATAIELAASILVEFRDILLDETTPLVFPLVAVGNGIVEILVTGHPKDSALF